MKKAKIWWNLRIICFAAPLILLVGCNLPQDGPLAPPVNATLTSLMGSTQAAQPAGHAVTAGPSKSESAGEPEAAAFEGTSTPGMRCDRAAPGVPIDITIPDDTMLEAGQPFTKIWRLQNVGECTWSADYAIEFFSGEPMGAVARIPLSQEVLPGHSVEIAVDLVAPRQAGKYQGNWKLCNAEGDWFGIGPNGDSPFWVSIYVLPPPTGTPAPATLSPTVTPTPSIQISGNLSLAPGDILNLDQNQVNGEQSEADLAYEINGEQQRVLVSLGSAAVGLFGSYPPGLKDCQDAALDPSPLVIEEFSGAYLCYRTDLGLPGYLFIAEAASGSSQLDLVTLTWSLP